MNKTLLILSFLLINPINVTKDKFMEKAKKLQKKIFCIDTHTDTPMNFFDDDFNVFKENSFEKSRSRVDFPRMEKGGLDAVFFAAFIGQGKRTPEANSKATERAIKIINKIKSVIASNNSVAEMAYTPKDALTLFKKQKKAVFIGIENGYPLAKDISLVKKFYNLGARYITLCHTKNNDICDSSTDEKEHNGLSEFGKKVVKEMNRLGMIIDVSHISDKSFYDVLEFSNAPVIASHSDARAICNHPRNLSDDMIIKLAEKGGVLQLCILSDYVKEIKQSSKRTEAIKKFRAKYSNWSSLSPADKAKARAERREINKKYPVTLATVKDLVDHIDHIVKLVGIDYVGIGTDFDGGGGLADCKDVSELPNITAELLRRGYSEKEIEKIWGGNFLRVFKAVQNKRQ